MSGNEEQSPHDNGIEHKAQSHAFHAHANTQSDSGHDTVERIRQQHKKKKSKQKKTGRKRLIFWSQILIAVFICITAGLTMRAIEIATIRSGGTSWIEEIKRGHYGIAADKFSAMASIAVSQVFASDLSTENIMKDFNAALPHLKQAGYILTEMEVEIGFPPKLIPHFYHDPKIELDLNKTLKALGDNNLGSALIIALAEAGELQKQLEVAEMQFNHIEVELGPIPALRLQYKNDHAIKDYIHRSGH